MEQIIWKVTTSGSFCRYSVQLDFPQEYVLTTNDLTSLSVQEPDAVVTGCVNGNLIFWDLQKATVNKM
jgi:hypothetical protein